MDLRQQNKCHQHVYLVDGDDFYFWICLKIFTRKKLGHFEIRGPLFPETTFFSNCVFPSQNLNKKYILFSELAQLCLTNIRDQITSLSLALSRCQTFS